MTDWKHGLSLYQIYMEKCQRDQKISKQCYTVPTDLEQLFPRSSLTASLGFLGRLSLTCQSMKVMFATGLSFLNRGPLLLPVTFPCDSVLGSCPNIPMQT